MTVIIADDSAMSRKITIRALPPDWDVEVVQVANGQQALDFVRENRADLMLLDLTMPEVGGLEVLETIHREDINCLVIVISADVQRRTREKSLALGALAFLRKPLQPQALMDVLKEFGLR